MIHQLRIAITVYLYSYSCIVVTVNPIRDFTNVKDVKNFKNILNFVNPNLSAVQSLIESGFRSKFTYIRGRK
jgi:hypothetical protein